MLWGRAANRCAMCRKELVAAATETDDESITGDEAHIVAESPDGPRGKSPLTREERNRYDNLLLLCKTEHKQVDDQPGTYTVDVLLNIKAQHEKWVRDSLDDFDAAWQRDDEFTLRKQRSGPNMRIWMDGLIGRHMFCAHVHHCRQHAFDSFQNCQLGYLAGCGPIGIWRPKTHLSIFGWFSKISSWFFRDTL